MINPKYIKHLIKLKLNKIIRVFKWIKIMWKIDYPSIYELYIINSFFLSDIEYSLKNREGIETKSLKKLLTCKESFKRLAEDDWSRFDRKIFHVEVNERFEKIEIDGKTYYKLVEFPNDANKTKSKIERSIKNWHLDNALKTMKTHGESWW